MVTVPGVTTVSAGSIAATGMSVVGSIGLGLEYFIASNLAVGLDVKYLIGGSQPFAIRGQVSGSVHPNTLYSSVGMRVFFP